MIVNLCYDAYLINNSKGLNIGHALSCIKKKRAKVGISTIGTRFWIGVHGAMIDNFLIASCSSFMIRRFDVIQQL